MNSLTLTCLLFLSPINCYKILVYSNLFGHSHIQYLANVADSLTQAGHDVTVLMSVIDISHRNRTGLKLTRKQIFVEADEKVIEMFAENDAFMKSIWVDDTSSPLSIFLNRGGLSKLFGTQCEKVMRSDSLLEQLRQENFNLAITEPFDLCAYAFFEYLQIPAHVSMLASARMDHVVNAFGLSSAISYVPSAQSSFSDQMTIWQRFINFLLFYSTKSIFEDIGDIEFQKAREYLGVQKTWSELLAESSFLMVNQMPLLSFAEPTFDKIVPMVVSGSNCLEPMRSYRKNGIEYFLKGKRTF